MGRDSGDDQSGWGLPSLYGFVGDYGPFKAKGFDPIVGSLVWIHHSGDINEEDASYYDPKRHAMHPLAGPIQDLLCGDRKKEPRFTNVIVVDVADMFESYAEYQDALFEEIGDPELTRGFGKKLLKLFQKLMVYRCSMAARGELCAVLLKLYKGLEQLDTTAKMEENNTVAEVWLLHPELLSLEYIALQFGPTEAEQTLTHTHPVELNVVYTEDCGEEIRALQRFFPTIGNEVAFEGPVNDWFAIVARRRDAKKQPETYDASRCNTMGKMLFLSLVKLEMNRVSKQYERNTTEITPDLLQIKHIHTDPSLADGSGGEVDWSTCERHIGGLLLRGNRCLLVRSVDHDYEGLRIPYMPAEPGETPHDTAIRAVSEHASVDDSEMRPLCNVPPVYMYGPNGLPFIVEVYPLYAVSAPPEGAENDDEDPDDAYDWFRFPKATQRMADDPPSVTCLQTMVMHLMPSVKVGLVPAQWGGVFGQEWDLLSKLE